MNRCFSRHILGAFACLALAACTDLRTTSPATSTPAVSGMTGGPVIASEQLPSVRVSEFHYDNAGGDIDEKIEISGPAGTSLVGWQIVRYNGNSASRLVYTSPAVTTPLPSVIPATPNCGDRGVVVIGFAVNGLQNGGSTATGTTDPDGFALVNGSGQVVEFLSYEGAFTAADGAAAGMTSVDVGVRELGSEAVDVSTGVTSIKRNASGVWSSPSANSFGSCNDNDDPSPPQEARSVVVTPATATVAAGATQQFVAAAFDAASQAVSGVSFSWSTSDALTATVDGTGLVTALKEGDVQIVAAVPSAPTTPADTAILHVEAADPALPPVRFSELHYDNAGTDAGEQIEVEGPAGTDLSDWSIVLYDGNGGTSYATQTLSGVLNGSCSGRGVRTFAFAQIQNGAPDGMALVHGTQVVEFLSYEGAFTATNGPATGQLSKDIGVLENGSPVGQSLQRDGLGAWSGPAASSFDACNGTETPPPAQKIITFVGRAVTAPPLPVGFEDQLFATELQGKDTIRTTFSWTSETPGIASVDANGVMHAIAVGTATFRATAEDGTTGTFSLPMADPAPSATAVWGGNTEFGDPIGSNDVIIRRDQFTASFSLSRNIPNWVSAKLEASHFIGGVDRCDCFTYDPLLPANYPRYTTGDYTGIGAVGLDRGHLLRSFDVTASDGDNKFSYLFSNIIPQSHDMNTGAWAELEVELGNLARSTKDVYMVAGATGSKGTVNNAGKITIPASVWKVALILDHGKGLLDVHSPNDLQVVAVIMPNESGTNAHWKTYETTIDAVEALSGYDVFSLLPDQIEFQVESGSRPPVAVMTGSLATTEGGSISVSGTGSSDPDGDAITYSWNFGDGETATGVSATHTYVQDGTYGVTLTVTDPHGIIATATGTASVANVAPTISALAGATLLPGETYSADGSFSDPGADSWTATVDYGDGSVIASLPIPGKAFSLSHTYATAGTFTIIVQVTDDDVVATQTRTITVLTTAAAARTLLDLVDAQPGNSLTAKLSAAIQQLEQGKTTPAINQLQAFLNEIAAMVRSGRLTAAEARPLQTMAGRIMRSLSP